MCLCAWQSVVPLSPLWTFKSLFLSELWGCVLWQNVRQLNSHGSLSWRWAHSSSLLYRQQNKWTASLPAIPLHILWLSNLALNPHKTVLSKEFKLFQLTQGGAVSLTANYPAPQCKGGQSGTTKMYSEGIQLCPYSKKNTNSAMLMIALDSCYKCTPSVQANSGQEKIL